MKSNKEKAKNYRREILFLLTQDLESPSGLGRYFPLSKYLSKEGLSVTIAALHSNFDTLETRSFIQEGVNVHYVAQMHVKKENNQTKHFNSLQLFWHSINATWQLFIFLMKHPAETVVIGKPHPMNSIAGILGGFFKGAKVILDCDDYEAVSNYFSSKCQQAIVKFFEDMTPRFVNQITTNTLFNKERMIALGIPSKKIHYLPNGVDEDRFKKINKNITTQISNKLELSNKKIIAYIGSLNLSNHPVDLLINAFKQITEKLNNIILIIVGGGRDIDNLKQLVDNLDLKDKVFFEGRVPPATVPNYYELADVTVDPVYDVDSAKGRCPLKMFESWLMGTPFVTSDVGDRRYLSGYSNIQLLAKPGDPEDLASKILKIITDPELKGLLIKEGSERVKNYSWRALIIDNLNIFTF